ncbi:MAG: hypothetical protein ACRDLN_10005, partial [Solirubrobacteraceae bacterium]
MVTWLHARGGAAAKTYSSAPAGATFRRRRPVAAPKCGAIRHGRRFETAPHATAAIRSAKGAVPERSVQSE